MARGIRNNPEPLEGEIIPNSGGTQVTVAPAAPLEILNFIQGQHVHEQDANEVRLSIARQVFAADTFEGIFERRTPVMSKDYLDKPFTVVDVKWNKSRFSDQEGALTFWALIDAIDVNGEQIMIGTSSFDAMLKLYRGHQLGLDWGQKRLRFTRAEHPTDRGFYPVFLDTAD